MIKRINIALLTIVFAVSCATQSVAPENKSYLIREFNDNGVLISETVASKYEMKFERLFYFKNGKKIESGENFEIRQIEK